MLHSVLSPKNDTGVQYKKILSRFLTVHKEMACYSIISKHILILIQADGNGCHKLPLYPLDGDLERTVLDMFRFLEKLLH